jgi:hypothetical protein
MLFICIIGGYTAGFNRAAGSCSGFIASRLLPASSGLFTWFLTSGMTGEIFLTPTRKGASFIREALKIAWWLRLNWSQLLWELKEKFTLPNSAFLKHLDMPAA